MDTPTSVATESTSTGDALNRPTGSETSRPVHQDVAVIETELLIEEISIDGMCGVY